MCGASRSWDDLCDLDWLSRSPEKFLSRWVSGVEVFELDRRPRATAALSHFKGWVDWLNSLLFHFVFFIFYFFSENTYSRI